MPMTVHIVLTAEDSGDGTQVAAVFASAMQALAYVDAAIAPTRADWHRDEQGRWTSGSRDLWIEAWAVSGT